MKSLTAFLNESLTSSLSLSDVLESKGVLKIAIAVLGIGNLAPIIFLRFFSDQMYPFFFLYYLWVPIYVLTIALLIFYNKEGQIKPVLTSSVGIICVVGLSLITRLMFLGSANHISLDTLWYLDYGKMMLQGKMPYADFYFLYPPVFGYFIYVISSINPFIDSFRLLSSLFDAAIVLALWRIMKQREFHSHQELIPLAYALLPISIIESGLNGHFEPIANLTLLIGLWWMLNRKYSAGSIMIGLSGATKVYALFLMPILFLIIPNNQQRIKSLLLAGFTFFLTFIPFSIPVWVRGDMVFPGMPMPGNNTGFLDSTLGFLSRINSLQFSTFSILVISAIAILCYSLFKLIQRKKHGDVLSYHLLSFGLGLILFTMAMLALLYPFLAIASTVPWRFPGDVALLKGSIAIVVSLLIIYSSILQFKDKTIVKVDSKQIVLVGSTLMLLILSLVRQAFFGWYFLWSIPPLILIRDKRMLLSVFVCILIIYPTYTHDNFHAIGYDESVLWQDPMEDVGGWDYTIKNAHLFGSPVNVSVSSNEGIGTFSATIPSPQNRSLSVRPSIVWHKNVSINLEGRTTLVTDMSISWNPSFGKWADVFVNYRGVTPSGSEMNGTILSNSTIYTNHSFFLWRHSFPELVNRTPITITSISIELWPLRSGNMSILVRNIYTVRGDILFYYPLEMFAIAIPLLISVYTLWRALPDTLFPRRVRESQIRDDES